MDSADVRIFCEIAFRSPIYDGYNVRRRGASEIGRKLGLDEKTVRSRIEQMERSGFIKYYQATPDLTLFGMRDVGIFRFGTYNLATKFALIDKMQDVPRLIESTDYIGLFSTASIAGASPEEVRREADGLTRLFELSTVRLGDWKIKSSSARLDRLDWQIIKGLRYDARTSDKDLAEKLSVTVRVVGYRTARLLESGAVNVKAVINPQKQEGLIFYELEVFSKGQGQREISMWLRQHFGEKLWNLVNPAEGVILASLFCFSMAEPEESVMTVLRQDGVARCRLYILKEVIEPKKPNWIDSLIEFRIGGESEGPKESLG